MTRRHTRAELEAIAARATAESSRHFEVTRALLRGDVHWIHVDCDGETIGLGLCGAARACGGTLIVQDESGAFDVEGFDDYRARIRRDAIAIGGWRHNLYSALERLRAYRDDLITKAGETY